MALAAVLSRAAARPPPPHTVALTGSLYTLPRSLWPPLRRRALLLSGCRGAVGGGDPRRNRAHRGACQGHPSLQKVDRHPDFKKSRCLFAVRTDGETLDFSYRKCLKEYIKEKYPSQADDFIQNHLTQKSWRFSQPPK